MPRLSSLENRLHDFSPGERLLFYILTALLGVSVLVLLARANALVSVEVPASGGSLTEGVVGLARFANPLLALSGPDKDLTALVYSGLMRATPEGTLIPDLAEAFEISEDGLTYTFTLKDDLTFHDGQPLSADDVVFTVQRAQNPDIKSTHRADWEGVTASAPDQRTVVFTLPHPYAPFLENTTLGILPKHLWENVSADEFPFHSLNTHPVGSGPYEIEKVVTDATGAAERYVLTPFRDFALGEPHILRITLLFYSSEEELLEAFRRGDVDSIAGISPKSVGALKDSGRAIAHVALPRTFGVFLNQNKNPVLADIAVRKALDAAVDKENIVREILDGYGAVLDGPIPPGILGSVIPGIPEQIPRRGTEGAGVNKHTEEARAILERNDWKWSEEEKVWKKKKDTLSLVLVTADEPELSATAEAIARDWQALGVKVETHVYPISELNNTILRPRNYDAVLFGEVVGRALDLFAFWHSSQRNDPGLNLALYTSSEADTLLAEGRATTDKEKRDELYAKFAEQVVDDQPAVFLFSPEFIYIVPENLRGLELGALTTPAERFLNVYEWHTGTERVWSIFKK